MADEQGVLKLLAGQQQTPFKPRPQPTRPFVPNLLSSSGKELEILQGNLPYLKALRDRNVHVFPDVTEPSRYSKYGVNVSRFNDYNYERAKAQSWQEQAVNMFKQMGAIVAGETISGFGALPALVEGIADEIKGSDATFSNALMELGEHIQEQARESGAPIYRTAPDKAWDIGDFGWWTSNATSIASSFGLMIPGYITTWGVGKALGGLGKAARAASIAAKGEKALLGAIGKTLASGSKLGQGLQYAGRVGTMSGVMRNAENFKESMQVKQQLQEEILGYNDLELADIKRNDKLAGEFLASKGFSINNASKDEIADFVSTKAAWHTYGLDAINIIFDAVQVAPLFRGIKPATRTLINPAKVVDANRVASGLAAMTRGERFAQNLLYYGLGTVGFETITEGIEEAVNHIASESGLEYGKFLMGQMDKAEYDTRFSRYIRDPLMWEQAFWGAMGGLVFSGGSRVLRTTQDALLGRDDPHSIKNRVGEIGHRSVLIGEIMSDLQALNEGLNPLIKDADDNYTALDPGQEDLIRAKVIEKHAGIMGEIAARRMNVNLLLSQLNTPEFRDTLIKQNETADNGLSEQQIDDTLESIKETVVATEKAYSDIAGVIWGKKIDDTIKPLIINDLMDLNRADAIHESAMNEAIEKVVAEMNNPSNKIIIDKFNKDNEANGFTFNDVLRKVAATRALLSLKGAQKTFQKSAAKNFKAKMVQEAISKGTIPDLDAIDREATKIQDPIMANRLIQAQNAVTDIINKLDNVPAKYTSSNAAANAFIEKYASDSMIENQADAMAHEALKNMVNKEVEDILTNTEEAADVYKKEFERDKATAMNLYTETMNERVDEAAKKLREAETADEIDKQEGRLETLNESVEKAKAKDVGTPEINAQYDKLITRTNEIIKAHRDARARAEAESRPYVMGEELIDSADNEIETLQPVKPMHASVADPNLEQEADSPVEATIDFEYTPDFENFSIFLSSIYNINKTLNADNIITLNKEEARVWDIVANKIKVGDVVVVKRLEEQTKIIGKHGKERERTISEKLVGIYTSDGTLIGMLPEVQVMNGTPTISHKGLIHTPRTSWVTKLISLMEAGMAGELIEDIMNMRLAAMRRGAEATADYLFLKNKLLNNQVFVDIMNTNRTDNPLNPTKRIDENTVIDEQLNAINHILSVVTFGYSEFDIKNQNYTLDDVVASMRRWNSRIANDLVHYSEFRNALDDPNIESVSVAIEKKTPGSVLTNRLPNGEFNKSKLNNVVSENVDDLNVPMLFVQFGTKTKLLPGNEAAKGHAYDIDVSKEEPGYEGSVYIPLKVGTVNGQTEYKYFRAQNTSYKDKHLPKDVVAYNKALASMIADRIAKYEDYRVRGDRTVGINEYLDELAEILKYYFIVHKVTDKTSNKTIGVNIESRVPVINPDTGKQVMRKRQYAKWQAMKIKINESNRPTIVSMYGEVGLEAPAEDKSNKLYERLVKSGTLRTVHLVNNKGNMVLPSGKFKDIVTGIEYNSYTEFLVDTGAVTTFYGAVRDGNNKLVTNVSAFSDKNAKGQNMIVMVNSNGQANFKTPFKEKSVTDFNVKYNTVREIGTAINPNNDYDFLFEYLDALGVKIHETVVATDTHYLEYVDNKIQLTTKFFEMDASNQLYLLAHDSIHALINNNLTEAHRTELDSIVNTIKENVSNVMNKLQYTNNQKKVVNDIMKEIEGNNEELITYALTNRTFAGVLNAIESVKTAEVKKEGIVARILRVITEALSKIFNRTLLNDVADVLESVMTETNTDTKVDNNENRKNASNTVQDILNKFKRDPKGKKAVVADVNTDLGTALDLIKSLNTEQRAINRELINNGNVIFKC